ncbi:MAG: pyridoxal phosphate-dependent class II aminotransferase [Deltaproteobacteria bacterium]|nr:pyridoxal phosphate-dependent class II aminotransferase [Deltaproteobacteria bacterium]
MTEHRHGGRVFDAARELGMPWNRILDFSANINPSGQPKGLKAHLFANFPETVHYPDVKAGSLVKAVADATGLPAEAILPGAGSTPHIRMIARILAPKRPVIIGPAFAEYEEALTAAGKKPAHVGAQEKNGFEVTLEEVRLAAKLKPDLIFLANPANPTGKLLPGPVLDAFLQHGNASGCWIVLDEAFIDFTEERSREGTAAVTERFLVLRSLTKIFAIPGLRLAYLVGHPESVKPLADRLEPWPLNSMALEAGLFCLSQKAFADASSAVTSKLRKLLQAALSPYGKLVDSDANFILMDAGPKAEGIIARLYKKGILVRDASNFRGLGPGWLRFAVRPAAEIKALSEALASENA